MHTDEWGKLLGYSIPTTCTNHANCLCKGTRSGAINAVWDRWTVQEGRIPEPGTLGLLAPAARLLFMKRRRGC